MNSRSIKICSFCGEEIKSIAIKCRYCGSMLTDTPSASLTGVDLVKQALGSRYEIHEEIGRGGMATVYKAVQKSLDRTVALKVVHQNLLHDTEFVARFHREAKLCASLNHPNIVTVHDEGEVSGVHFMAMEYLEGQDLRHLIRSRGKLTPEQTLQYLLPVAEALDYAHGRGLIHRDIKSANIFICGSAPSTGSGAARSPGTEPVEVPRSRVVLMDFGIAHAAAGTQLTKAGAVIGTPEYMSPEQADGRRVDARTDLYSLGVVMYECLTGRVPFTSDNAVSTIYKVINEKPDEAAFGNITYRVKVLAMSLLSKNPDHRPSSGAATAQAIRQLQQGKEWKPPATFHSIPSSAGSQDKTIKLSATTKDDAFRLYLSGERESLSDNKGDQSKLKMSKKTTIRISKSSPQPLKKNASIKVLNLFHKLKQPKLSLLTPAAFLLIIIIWFSAYYYGFLINDFDYIPDFLFFFSSMFFASLTTSYVLRYLVFFD